MSDLHVSIGGLQVTHARICVPNRGVWFAELDLADDTELTGAQTLQVGDAAFVGTVDPGASGTFALSRKLRLIGGANGWSRLLGPRAYHADNGVRTLTVTEDAAREAGETLATGPQPSQDRIGVDFVRQSGPASRTLEKASGEAVWWVDYAGLTHVGERPGVAADPDTYEVLECDPRYKIVTLAVDDIAAIGIGSTLSERLDTPLTVRELEIIITPESIRATAWCGGEAVTEARLPALLQAIIRHTNDEHLWGCYRYRVVRMSANRVELQSVTRADGLPDILPISMWSGPGTHAKLTPGSECLVQFVAGDRTQPVVTGFAPKDSSAFVPELLEFAGGDFPLARQGDLVQCGGTGTVVTLVPVTGSPAFVPIGVPLLISFSATPPVPGLAAPLYGSIASGSPRVKSG